MHSLYMDLATEYFRLARSPLLDCCSALVCFGAESVHRKITIRSMDHDAQDSGNHPGTADGVIGVEQGAVPSGYTDKKIRGKGREKIKIK